MTTNLSRAAVPLLCLAWLLLNGLAIVVLYLTLPHETFRAVAGWVAEAYLILLAVLVGLLVAVLICAWRGCR